jgi:protein-disulfide isomerase
MVGISIIRRVEPIVMVSCALTLTGFVLYRQLSTEKRGGDDWRTVAGWQSYGEGHRLGRADAPLTLVEFADFQCPFCAAFDTTLQGLVRRRSDEVSVIFRHYPLTGIHPQAFAAAVASECAGEQNQFHTFRMAVYTDQQRIGARSWVDFARQAGVRDTGRFTRCLADSGAAAHVKNDVQAATQLRLKGTPSVLVGDQLIEGALAPDALDRAIDDALRRQQRTGSWMWRLRATATRLLSR